MSLTGLLARPSLLRAYFENEFPQTAKFALTLNTQAAKLPIHGNVRLTRGEAALVGIAFDYRVRLFLRKINFHDTVAFQGLNILWDELTDGQQAIAGKVLRSCLYHIARIKPQGRRLRKDEEEVVGLACLIFAFAEQFYRAQFPPQVSPLYLALEDGGASVPGVKECLSSRYRHVITDVGELLAIFSKQCLLPRRAILNPTFVGSNFVGGADADLILDGTLFDLKTTRDPRPINRQSLWQLVGYALLDYENRYKIRAVGFYFARHAWRISWPIEDFLTLLSGSSSKLVARRKEMRRLLRGGLGQEMAS